MGYTYPDRGTFGGFFHAPRLRQQQRAREITPLAIFFASHTTTLPQQPPAATRVRPNPTQHNTNPLARSLALSTPLHGTDRVDPLACSLLHAPAHLLLLSTSSSPAPLAPLHTPAEEASLAIWLCACVLLVAFGSLSLSLSSRAPKGCVRCSVTRRRDVRHVRSLAFDRRRRRRRRSHPKHLPLLPRPCVRE